MIICHLSVFFGEVSIQIFSQVLDWVVYFLFLCFKTCFLFIFLFDQNIDDSQCWIVTSVSGVPHSDLTSLYVFSYYYGLRIWTWMHIGALFVRASNWKQPKYSIRGERVNKSRHILRMESTWQSKGCTDTHNMNESQNKHAKW